MGVTPIDYHPQEERHIFPILAKKMPQFKAGARESGQHLKSHKQIHAGKSSVNVHAIRADVPQAWTATLPS
jgi:hypothetical protein